MQDIKRPSLASKSRSIKVSSIGRSYSENDDFINQPIDSIKKIYSNDLKLEDDRKYIHSFKSSAGDDYFSINRSRHRDIDGKLNAFEKRVSNHQSISDINKKEKKLANANRNIKISLSIAILLFLFLILYFFITYIFNKTIVTVTPKIEQVSIGNNFTLDLDISNEENFKILELVKTEEATLPKSELQKVISKAKGKVTLYNNYSSSSQKLIKNTRLESENGKVFRITDSVVVPGVQGISPGKVVVDVIADDVGESYNISASRFTIPAFKDTDRYKGFYAISESNMSGGADGNKYVVAKEDIVNANLVKETNLTSILAKEVAESIGDNKFILATNTALYKFDNNLIEYEFNKDDKYKVTGTIYVIAINQKHLAKLLAQKNIKGYNGEEISIHDIKNLSFAYNEITKPNHQRLKDKQRVNVNIQGEVKLVYDVNKDLIKTLLLGSDNNKESFVQILGKMKNVDTVVAKVFPPWADKYPNNREKIEVANIYDN